MCVVESMLLYRMEKRVPEEKKRFERIVVHCSDSEFATALMIADWHRKKKWKTIGYHAVVQNGYPTASWWNSKQKIPYLEGAVEIGRPIDNDEWFEPKEQGAHVYGHNPGSFGVCMVGNNQFSNIVLNKTLDVVRFHLKQFKLAPSKETVKGHCELDSDKTCPNINMDVFRDHLIDGTDYGQQPQKPESSPTVWELIKMILKTIFKGKKL